MMTSESIKEIASALCEFQGKIGIIKKSEVNPFFKSKYADLSTILDAIQEPLAACGLSFVQFPTGNYGLETMLMHTSGEWMRDGYTMKPTKDDPQGAGSVITYQRRYALGAILGLNIDEDDDGNAGSEKPKKATTSSEAATDPLVGSIWKLKDGTFAQVFYNPKFKKNGYAVYPTAECDRNFRTGYLTDYEFDNQKVEQITK